MSRRCRATAHSDSSFDVAAEELHDALVGLVRLVQLRDRHRICCHDISTTQAYAIEEIHRASSLTLNELAAILHLDKSTTSRVVDALERKGYVSRATHPRDGRAVVLRVTASGRRLHHRIRDTLISETRLLLDGFDPKVRRGVTEWIASLATRLKSCSGEPDPSCGDRRAGHDGTSRSKRRTE